MTGSIIPIANAEFALNFQPVPNVNRINTLASCPTGGCTRNNTDQDPDTTPFMMETVIDPETGRGFYHVLIGDPKSDFAQEFYISYAGGTDWERGFPQNASAGTYNGGIDAKPATNFSGTFYDPLSASSTSGNGTGRPDRAYFRQTVKGAGFEQEVLKASLTNKPKITQSINDGSFSSNFMVDMSAASYSGTTALTTSAIITNTMRVTDAQTGAVLANFDINTDGQRSNVDAGKYVYNPGNGASGSAGTYTYTNGNFDVYGVEWATYLDPTINIPNF